MNEKEYMLWQRSMYAMLHAQGYLLHEIAILMQWWDGIKASKERELVGDETFEQLYALLDKLEYNSAHNWTIRLLFYAQYILKEHYDSTRTN